MNNHEQLTRPVFRFQALVYRDGNLVSGSLEALVQHMVPTEEYYPDRAYLFAFLLSARLFIKPHELLGEVCALCEHQQNLNGEGGKVRPHESSSSTLLLVPHKSPTRAFRACTLRPPRALSFHRLEAGSTPFSHSPPRRISLARPLSFHEIVIMSTRIQARNVSLANEFPPPRFFLSRFVVSLSGNIFSDFMCIYIYFFFLFLFSFDFCWGLECLIIGIRNAFLYFLFSCFSQVSFSVFPCSSSDTFVIEIFNLFHLINITFYTYMQDYVFEILIYF